jgi:hypothetical protein
MVCSMHLRICHNLSGGSTAIQALSCATRIFLKITALTLQGARVMKLLRKTEGCSNQSSDQNSGIVRERTRSALENGLSKSVLL